MKKAIRGVWRPRLVAFPGAEVSERELRFHLRGLLAPPKVPVRIWFVEALPRTRNGKLQRLRLQDELAGAQAAKAGRPT